MGQLNRQLCAILVSGTSRSDLDEAVLLCESAGYQVTKKIMHSLNPTSKYGMGGGLVESIGESVSRLHPDVVVYNAMLRPSQNYNLASQLKIKILDRTALILEIFELRASSDESRQQVRLAQLRYEMLHAREKVRLSKMGEQPGFMGIGKFEVDVYYNDIRHRMESVRAKLRTSAKRRELHRTSRRRTGLCTVSLAGYTSSGKTTLFNALTGEDKERSEDLFTTLATTVRRTTFGSTDHLISDTVGFISNLPAFMIEAFKSTLEEMTHADAIILVVDASDPVPLAKSKMADCKRTLAELDVEPARIIVALNKADLVAPEELDLLAESVLDDAAQAVRISASTGDGLDSLKQRLSAVIGGNDT